MGGVLVVLLAAGFAADATAQGVYLGGAYSWATADIEDVDANLIDDSANAYKFFLGYEFPQFIGVEAGYVDFGSYDIGSLEDESDPIGDVSSSGWTAALVGRIPLGQAFTLYAKVGAFMWDAEIEAAEDIGDLSGDGSDVYYGAGLRVNFGKVSIFGEYEMFDGEQVQNDLFSIGVRFSF
jgi:OOP family OmpA-OmpF porin